MCHKDRLIVATPYWSESPADLDAYWKTVLWKKPAFNPVDLKKFARRVSSPS